MFLLKNKFSIYILFPRLLHYCLPILFGVCIRCAPLSGKPQDPYELTNVADRKALESPDSLIISKIIFKGTLKGKEQYQRLYALEPGDFFDKTIHERSIERIKTLFKQNGYLASDILTVFTYHKKVKKIDITLTCNPGKRFTVRRFEIKFIHFSTADFSLKEKNSLQESCRKTLAPILSGRDYDQKIIDTCLEKLKDTCHSESFFNIALSCNTDTNTGTDTARSEVDLVFALDFEKAERYLFFGNIFFNNADLLKHITPFDTPLCIISPESASEDIMQSYKDHGFLACTVSVKKDNKTHRFIIREGLRFKITRVEVKGPDREKKRAAEYLNDLTRQTYYNADLLRAAFENMQRHYISEGFWDFSITKYELLPGKNPDEKKPVVTIHAGPQKFLKRVTIEKFPEIMQEPLFDLYNNASDASAKGPVPFDREIIQKQQARLSHYLQENGYLYGTFEPHLEPDSTNPNHITLVWKLTGLETQVTFGKTIVTGNSRIPTSLLLRGLAYQEGDTWNARALDKSLDRFTSLSVFKSVSLQPADFFTPEPSKKMVLKLIEEDPYELSVHAGIGFLSKNFDARGQGITYRVGGGFLYRNPACRGDTLRIDGDIMRYARYGALTYNIPHWTAAPTNTSMKLYGEQRDQPFFVGSPDILYRFLRTGGSLQFSGAYEHADWKVKSDVEWLKMDGLSLRAAHVLQFEPTLLNQFFPYFTVEPSFVFDYTDDPIKTTTGSFTSIMLKGMFPPTLKKAWLIKAMVEQSFFYPLTSWLVFALRVRLGTIGNASFERIMPPERFYLGGADSLRGYSPDLAPPLNRYIEAPGIERWVPIGGKSMFNTNMELRFPLYGNLGGAVFTDIGFLSQHGITSIMSEKLLGSNGFGLRYVTPVGVFRFDMGWKWEKHFVEDRAYAWFLSLGNVF